jgi:acyl carrier protein
MSRDVIEPLGEYVIEQHLDGRAEVSPDTPLLEWGILDSFSVAELLVFIEARFGVILPASSISPQHFGSLRTLAELVEAVRKGRYVPA